LVVAAAALIAALALAGLPGPAGSRTPSTARTLAPAAFTTIIIPTESPGPGASGLADAAQRSAGFLDSAGVLVEPGSAPAAPSQRPTVRQPASVAGSAWKPPLYTLSGYATFYDNGTTAMRLPRGTVVRVCGRGGCLERTVTDYGPVKKIRVVDMYRPDFFQVCGCPSWAGTVWVTVGVY
jgi:hypothetical protein